MNQIFKDKDTYYAWLSEDETSIQDTVDIALDYIAQLHTELDIAKAKIEQLSYDLSQAQDNVCICDSTKAM
jgi:hypothetical protein